jgi:hypothetical protein
MEDLMIPELRNRVDALKRDIGAKAEVYIRVSVQQGSIPYELTIYPDGISLGRTRLCYEGENLRQMMEAAEAGWREHEALHHAGLIRKMALAIISLTTDLGECTDAALRAEFAAHEVARFGKRACEQATAMAGRGPFSIVTTAGANAEAA